MISKTSGCFTSTNEPSRCHPLVVPAWDDLSVTGGGLCRCGCAQGGDDSVFFCCLVAGRFS